MGRVDEEFEKYERAREEFPSQVEGCLNTLLKEMISYAGKIIWQESHMDRPDVVNECLMKALKGGGDFHRKSRFSTWFYSIVVNTLRTSLRKEKRISGRELPLLEINALQFSSPHVRDYETDEAILDRVLNPQDRDFFNRKADAWSNFELGARFNLSPEGVRSRWRRIRAKLKKALP